MELLDLLLKYCARILVVVVAFVETSFMLLWQLKRTHRFYVFNHCWEIDCIPYKFFIIHKKLLAMLKHSFTMTFFYISNVNLFFSLATALYNIYFKPFYGWIKFLLYFYYVMLSFALYYVLSLLCNVLIFVFLLVGVIACRFIVTVTLTFEM